MSIQMRLMGLSDDIDTTVARLRETFTVIAVSSTYPNRGNDTRVRAYVTVDQPNRKDSTQ